MIRQPSSRRLLGAVLIALSAGCARPASAPVPAGDPPPEWMLGAFEDDYQGRHTITADAWTQERYATYRVVRWNAAGQYMVALNDAANPADGGKWTRIDWMRLEGMPPFAWAYCISTWNAATREEAEAASTLAHRETPRTGCGGHPFTRMKRADMK